MISGYCPLLRLLDLDPALARSDYDYDSDYDSDSDYDYDS
jgi:hypothetical protein